jgi:ADP-ribose pyrophosphatase YjhB (NUDIX family)
MNSTLVRQRYALNASVFVVVRRGDDILLLRRANTGWNDGQWSLPAGGHDGGETLEQAAAVNFARKPASRRMRMTCA